MSISIALITGVNNLRDFSIYGDCFMALTQLVLVYPDYAEFHKAMSQNGKRVILDNGAFELHGTKGMGLGAEDVLKAAAMIQATDVICQDFPFDKEKSYRLTKAFLDEARQVSAINKYRFMAVPQGRTQQEWMQSYQEMSQLTEVATIGLSKLSIAVAWGCELSEARIKCVQEIRRTSHMKPMHLLGGGPNLPYELQQLKQYPAILSNDSSFAWWYGCYERVSDPAILQIGTSRLSCLDELPMPDLERGRLSTSRQWQAALKNALLLQRCAK